MADINGTTSNFIQIVSPILLMVHNVDTSLCQAASNTHIQWFYRERKDR